MTKINILPPKVFNLLAAGEVVENPASVVKECIENSLDAGATTVEVLVAGGGLDEIRIDDNGSGVHSTEIEKIFLPHATSKIENEQDLDAIKTLGFRGEAMSSIARVSKVTIVSRTKEEASATKLSIDGGEVTKKTSIAGNYGTSISIKNLFYNTPARKKFLSSAALEKNNVTGMIQKFILANPKISFRYTVDKEIYYDYKGGELINAIEFVYGKTTTESIIEVDMTSPDYRLTGYISKPDFTKRNRTYQTVQINGRTIQGGTVAIAAANAFEQYSMVGTHSFFVLNLGIDEGSLDVNIHPRKLQVKFDDNSAITEFVHRAITTALDSYLYMQNKKVNTIIQNKIADINMLNTIKNFTTADDNSLMSAPHTMKKFSEKFYSDEPVNPTQAIFHDDVPTFKTLGNIFGCFILISSGEKLYVLDQHAAAERILYDQLRIQIDEGRVATQPLVGPIILHLNPTELNSVVKHLPTLEKIGILAEEFGNNAICIREVPVVIATHNALEDVLRGILGDTKKLKLTQMLEEKLLHIACKNSLRGGRTLQNDQIKMFLDLFKDGGIPPLCPHGRPIVVSFDKSQFEKMFKRQ